MSNPMEHVPEQDVTWRHLSFEDEMLWGLPPLILGFGSTVLLWMASVPFGNSAVALLLAALVLTVTFVVSSRLAHHNYYCPPMGIGRRFLMALQPLLMGVITAMLILGMLNIDNSIFIVFFTVIAPITLLEIALILWSAPNRYGVQRIS